jgi:hypothetical protein
VTVSERFQEDDHGAWGYLHDQLCAAVLPDDGWTRLPDSPGSCQLLAEHSTGHYNAEAGWWV